MPALPAAALAAHFVGTFTAAGFQEGILHTHTDRSDGDAPPAVVLERYRSMGFSFVSLTDHDKLTPDVLEGLTSLPGVEITGRAAAKTPVHVNALCGRSALKGERSERSAAEVLADGIAKAHADGALALVNHPNFGWALQEKELLEAPAYELLEIASGHPGVTDLGDASHASQEALWDAVLTRRGRVLGAASDDAHDFVKYGEGRAPGKAWVAVWGAGRDGQAVCAALRRGDFYAAKGARFSGIELAPTSLTVTAEAFAAGRDRIEFVGAEGKVLAASEVSPARYELRGGEKYVRARLIRADGGRAWTQAYYPEP